MGRNVPQCATFLNFSVRERFNLGMTSVQLRFDLGKTALNRAELGRIGLNRGFNENKKIGEDDGTRTTRRDRPYLGKGDEDEDEWGSAYI